MDIGGVRKAPAAAVYQMAANRPEPTPSGARAVATESPRQEAVNASAEARTFMDERRPADVEARISREQLLRDFIRSRAVTDPRTREVVFQTVNLRTGEVVKQFPDEVVLRMREYVAVQLDRGGAKPGERSGNLIRSA